MTTINCPNKECETELNLDKENNHREKYINCYKCGANFENPYYDGEK